MKREGLVILVMCCTVLGAFAATPVGPVPGPSIQRGSGVPVILLEPAEQAAPDQVTGFQSHYEADAILGAAGFERALPDPLVVEFDGHALPVEVPALFSGGFYDRQDNGTTVWTIQFVVKGAKAVQVHLRGVSLPEECRLSTFAPGLESPQYFSPAARTADGDLWSAMSSGPSTALTLEFPPGVSPAGRFEVAGIVEIVRPPKRAAVAAPPEPASEERAPESAAQAFAPPAPYNLTAQVTGTNTIALSWQYSSTKGKGFKVQRRLGTSGSWSLLVKIPGLGVTSYTDATVTPCQQYSYRVKTYTSSTASPPSNEVVITAGTPGAFTLTGTAECSGSNPQNRLQWTTSIAASTYDVYRNGALLASGQAGPPYLDASVTAGQNYLYMVAARNSCGARDSNEVGVTALSTCCPAPGSLTLTATADCAGGSPRIALSWTSSTGATAYDVYRNGASYAPGQVGTTYTDTSVTASTSYNYYVAARNSCGQTQSNTATATAGSAPGSFTLTVAPECHSGQPSISLQWTAASGVTSVSSYDVYRDGTLLATNRDQTITWHDTPLTGGTTHSYYIRAKNSCGTKDSNTASATAPTSCCTPPGDFTLTLTPGCHSGTPVLFLHWTAAANVPTTDSYDIYKDGSLLVADRDQTITWYDPAVTPGSTHSYFIRAKNSCSTTDSNTASAVVPTTCPTIVDELDAGFEETPALPGPWQNYSSSNCYDGHMYYVDNEHDTVTIIGRWYVNLPSAGWYTVSAFIGCRYNATVNARYWINSSSFTGPYVLNQYLYCYNWATVGNFYFADVATDYLYLSNYTGGVEPDNTTTVQFDAASWAP